LRSSFAAAFVAAAGIAFAIPASAANNSFAPALPALNLGFADIDANKNVSP
jgi:hypothetical protein